MLWWERSLQCARAFSSHRVCTISKVTGSNRGWLNMGAVFAEVVIVVLSPTVETARRCAGTKHRVPCVRQ